MTLAFRNLDADSGDPVESWPYEGLAAAIERGTVGDWARIVRAFDVDPWGPVARQVEDYLAYSRPWGVAPLLDRAIARARSRAEAHEREAVSRGIRDLVRRAGLPLDDFARRIGTSRSRLSTYRTGSVTPSAALVVRMRDLVERLESAGG